MGWFGHDIAFIVYNLANQPIGKKDECKFAIANGDLFHQSRRKDGRQ